MLKGGSSYFCNLARGHGASQSEKNHHHWKEKEEEEERKEGEDKGKKRKEAFFAKALMLLQREYIAFLLRALSTAFRPTFSKLRPARNIIRKPCCITFRVSRCFLFPSNQDQACNNNLSFSCTKRFFFDETTRSRDSFPRRKNERRIRDALSDVNNTRFFSFFYLASQAFFSLFLSRNDNLSFLFVMIINVSRAFSSSIIHACQDRLVTTGSRTIFRSRGASITLPERQTKM